MVKTDPQSYLWDMQTSCPENVFLLSVLERAIRDLDEETERNERINAQDWFDAKETLLPYGVGFGDVIDLLDTPRLLTIRRMVKRSKANEKASLFPNHKRRVR